MVKIHLDDGTSYAIPEDFYLELSDMYYDLDMHLQNMRIWCIANPTRRKTKKGIKRFVLSWLKREAKLRPRAMPVSVVKAEAVKKSPMPDSVRQLFDKMMGRG